MMWYKINKLTTLFYPQWTQGTKVIAGKNKFTQPYIPKQLGLTRKSLFFQSGKTRKRCGAQELKSQMFLPVFFEFVLWLSAQQQGLFEAQKIRF